MLFRLFILCYIDAFFPEVGVATLELRSLASAIKERTLTHLDEYLEQIEADAQSNGIQVHWACDAAEHSPIVHGMLKDDGAKSLIKKSAGELLSRPASYRAAIAATYRSAGNLNHQSPIF